jgi:hypothetical protein
MATHGDSNAYLGLTIDVLTALEIYVKLNEKTHSKLVR